MANGSEFSHDQADHHETKESEAHSTLFSLLQYAEQAKQDPSNRAELLHRLRDFTETELSWSPNIFNELPLSEQLDLATRFSRIPEAQGTVCQSFVGELTYNLQGIELSGDSSAEYLYTYIQSLPIEYQLDTLSYLSTIGANAAAQGWADQLSDSLNEVADDVAADPTTNPFLRYAAEATVTRLRNEQESPGGILVHQGDRSVGRASVTASESVMDSSQRLRHILKPDATSYAEGTLNRISKDVVASFDRSMIPQSFTKFSKEAELSHEIKTDAPDPRYTEHLAYLLNQEPTPQTIKQALDFTQTYLLPKTDKTSIFDQLHTISPNISAEQWQEYLTVTQALSGLRAQGQKYQYEQQQHAEEANLRESQNFINAAKQIVPILDQRRFANIITELAHSSEERQFKAAEELAVFGEYEPNAPAAVHALSKQSARLRRLFSKHFDLATQKTNKYFAELNIQAQGYFADKITAEQAILTPTTADNLRTYATKLTAESTTIEASFKPLATLLAEANVKTNDQEIDTVRLLEELHRPEMRARIEEDMGVDLTELTLREQVQLLTFLTHTSQANIDRTFNATKTFGVPCARSFLSAEAGDEFRDHILTISEQVAPETAQKIFNSYANLADLAQTTATNLAKEFFVPGQERTFDIDAIQAQLLTRAREILEAAAKHPEDTANLFSKLANAETSIILLAEMYRSIHHDNPDFSLEDVRHNTIEQMPATELSKQEKIDIQAIHRANWLIEEPRALSFLENILQEKLKSPSTNFHILKNNGRIVAFLRFDQKPDGSLYLGSVNVDSGLRGKAIGDAFLQKVIDEQAINHRLVLQVLAKSDIAKKYQSAYGFHIIAHGGLPLDDGTLEPDFTMERNDLQESQLAAK
ncbi:TPA: hypothetical protein DEP96_02140 [Candidatus Uhrbacteria bacterium]|nr:hypothetical protein [Candidatus Uhrbacteria bacterium]